MIWRAVYVRFWRTRPWPGGSALLVVRACISGPGTNAPGPFSNSFISAVHRSSVPVGPPSSAALPGDGKPRPPWRFEYRLQPRPARTSSTIWRRNSAAYLFPCFDIVDSCPPKD